ncbi:type I phosphomannose isomerase catalytic subunit [Rubinisphaera italica]|uniref:Phosphohexomutase n=1 Tax=Rubinisphaera italica TaxID=2527969 RepID=A0A5C5WYL4_9PLAN|nr:type I phosphomannose isomerase catalytic subunit [Rubinisphaera italica]TWT55680.1 putative mannose-6-phosphate isomerase GmuF [Rubinisphaera italica]
MEPLQFTPILKCRRWGGRKLGDRLGKSLEERQDYAESWEICDMGESQSVVQSGPHAGKTLNELVKESPEEFSEVNQFPLLMKYLDSHQASSLQVHPNDDQAMRIAGEQNGKTEAWVILEAAKDSWLYAGLKSGITRNDFVKALAAGNITSCLHRIEPKQGEVYYIPAGTIHALGDGILVAEIQQSSDLTYRIHDWGWVDENGQPRELHLKEALECIDFECGPVEPVSSGLSPQNNSNQSEFLIDSPYFQVERFSCPNSRTISEENQCRILMVLEGACKIATDATSYRCETGSTLLLPASCPEVVIESETDDGCQILLTRVV